MGLSVLSMSISTMRFAPEYFELLAFRLIDHSYLIYCEW